jgi:hypothetical protein
VAARLVTVASLDAPSPLRDTHVIIGEEDEGTIKTVIAVVGLLVSAIGLTVAIFSLIHSDDTARDQKKLQAQVEERSLAPVLAAGVEPSMRGKTVTLHTIVGKVVKPAEAPVFASRRRLLVVPVWNVGNGLAVWRRTKVLTDCDKAFNQEFAKRPTNSRRLGFYNVPDGQSEQLSYPVRSGAEARAAAEAAKKNKLSVFTFYTDLVNSRDRATCAVWKRGNAANRWKLSTQDYVDR